jgi:hypothetical protein
MKRWGIVAVLAMLTIALPSAAHADVGAGTISVATASPDGSALHAAGSVHISECDQEPLTQEVACDPISLITRAERHGACPSGTGLDEDTIWDSQEAVQPGDTIIFDVDAYNELGWYTPCVYVVQRDVGYIPAIHCLEGFAFSVREELCPAEKVVTLSALAVRRAVYKHQHGEYWTGCAPYPEQERWLVLIEAHGVSCQRARQVLKPLQQATIWKVVEHLEVSGFQCTYYVGDGTRPTRIDCHRGKQRIREEMP